MKESDMYEPVKQFLLDHLACDRVVAEVFDFDVLGLCGDHHNVIVEMKKGLNFKVIKQAMRAKQYAHWVYIAVIRPTKQNDEHEWVYETLLKPHGIGLLYVDDPDKSYSLWRRRGYDTSPVGFAIEEQPQGWRSPAPNAKIRRISVAKYTRRPNTQRRISQIKSDTHTHASYIRSNIPDWADENIGGVKGGDARQVTAYSKLMSAIRSFLEDTHQYNDKMGLSLKAIVNHIPLTQSHYGNPVNSLRATLQESWNSDWIDVAHYKQHKLFRLNYKNPHEPKERTL